MTPEPYAEQPRLLLLITEDWYFWSHRLELARAARSAGWDVSIGNRVRDHGKRIEDEGFHLHPLRLVRSSRHPVRELLAIFELVRLYRRALRALCSAGALQPGVCGALAGARRPAPLGLGGFGRRGLS